MPRLTEDGLAEVLAKSCRIGEIAIRKTAAGFVLCHREDETRSNLRESNDPEEAMEIARFDGSGNYRPLKTAPTLRRGWLLRLTDLAELRQALGYFYPGRVAIFEAWRHNHLTTIPLRETLERQSGMYRVAATISDDQVNDVVGNFCRSDGGCLRTILWKRDRSGAPPSKRLPPEKFDPSHDQVNEERSQSSIPLLCQEACNLLVAECRRAVKGE